MEYKDHTLRNRGWVAGWLVVWQADNTAGPVSWL